MKEADNSAIRAFAARPDRPEIALVEPENFLGPDALLLGRIDEEGVRLAAALAAGYSRRADAAGENPTVRVTDAAGVRVITVQRQLTGAAFTVL